MIHAFGVALKKSEHWLDCVGSNIEALECESVDPTALATAYRISSTCIENIAVFPRISTQLDLLF